jgi:hypothetical protein
MPSMGQDFSLSPQHGDQTPIPWVPEALSPGEKWTEHDAAKARVCGIMPTLPICLLGLVLDHMATLPLPFALKLNIFKAE